MTDYPPPPPPPGPDGSLLRVKSHEEGRNSDVALFPDRIERVRQKKMGSLSRARQDAEVIPMRSVSSVQAKKDGLVYTKVTVFASGNTVEFRLRHDEAQRFHRAVTDLLLQHGAPAPSPVQHAAPSAPPGPSSVADELTKLAGLRDAGVLSVEEFETQKARLLGS